MTEQTADLFDVVVIGGGVMGLFTAYYAAAAGNRVAVLERGRIGDPATASYGRTRSYRRDYLDPVYVRYAEEATRLWTEFESDTGSRALVRCGCMNIASKSVTGDLEDSYAQRTADVLQGLDMPVQLLAGEGLAHRFPYLAADVGYLDESAGLVDVRAVTDAPLRACTDRKVDIREGVGTAAITSDSVGVDVRTDTGELTARALVITAGHGSNGVLARLAGCTLQISLAKDRPSEAKYFVPPPKRRPDFMSDVMPVIAYLDTGIYLHPIVEGVTEAVKIGYYNLPDLPRDRTGIANIAEFVATCMPGLSDAQSSDVRDVDQCDYDLVADDEFVLGAVPGIPNAFVGVGWRGTGYKFAPWVGRVLCELALNGRTGYDIDRFDPARFDGKGSR